jgi:putative lipoic acid-binding regulatory protein
MGIFDPQGEDDERQAGNILNAMLRFPVKYSFNIVGKTSGNDAVAEEFVQQVKDMIIEATGDMDGIQCQTTPRGKNYTKVTVQATVESVAMITAAYNSLESLERTVMRF